MPPTEAPDALERAKLNQETAKIPWTELQRFFAQGRVIWVRPGLDLVEVALAMAKDDARAIDAERAAGGVGPVTDDQARAWLECDASLWAVVVKPWILAQEVECTSGSTPTPAQGSSRTSSFGPRSDWASRLPWSPISR